MSDTTDGALDPSTLPRPRPNDGETAWQTVSPDGWPPPHVHLKDPDPPPTAPTPPGTGRYQILEEIARGGMGAVMRGRDSELNRDLAVKVLLEKYRDEPGVLRRFFEEAQIGGQLQHPGIVPIYDLGTFADRRPFFAMKLVKGRTLADLLKERATPSDDLPRFLAIFEQVAQAVAYAHSRGVIHRDLKPQNIMVGAFGEVQVMDWGLAKVLGADRAEGGTEATGSMIRSPRSGSEADASLAGSILGTPGYMAPEQARGEVDQIDERADVFGLGAILCKILTGEPAFTGRGAGEVLRKTGKADLADALGRLEAAGAEAPLLAIARSCLAAEPPDRPRDAGQVAASMKDYLEGVQERLRAAELARVEATAQAGAERTRRRFTVALTATTLLAMTLIGGSWMAFRLDRDAQLAKTDGAVGEALARADAARSEAQRAGIGDEGAWDRALVAADRARDQLAGRPARAGLDARVAAFHEAVRRETDQARDWARRREADRKLVAELDEDRLLSALFKNGDFDLDSKYAAYERTFRNVGVDFAATSADEATRNLIRRGEPVRIAAALDDWTPRAADPAKRALLSTVARRIDPDPYRDRIRLAVAAHDSAALIALAGAEEAASLPASSVLLLADTLITLNRDAEAIELLDRSRLRFPSDFWIHHYLGMLWTDDPAKWAEATRFLSIAVAVKPDSPGAHLNLSACLAKQGRFAEAVASCRTVIRLSPDIFAAHGNLGVGLAELGRFDEAAPAFREAIRLNRGYARAYSGLGLTLMRQGKFAEAVEPLLDGIRLNPKDAKAHHSLALALLKLNRITEAIEHIDAALRLAPDDDSVHVLLGNVRFGQRRLAEAGESYQTALRLNPKNAFARYNLGNVLLARKKFAEAIASFHEAIDLNPGNAEAHCNLGHALQGEGRFVEALESFRRGHELGMKLRDWNYRSADWVAQCEELVRFEARLVKILKGEQEARNTADRLDLGHFCFDTRRYAASARFWGEALANDPRLGDDRKHTLRSHAASSAALAGTGQGRDDPRPDDDARANLRAKARAWLAEEVGALRTVADSGKPDDLTLVARTLIPWKKDPDLAGIREADALSKLPQDERKAWQALWADVDALLDRTSGPPPR